MHIGHVLNILLLSQLRTLEKVSLLANLLTVVFGVHWTDGEARQGRVSLRSNTHAIHEVALIADQGANACSVTELAHFFQPSAQVEEA